MEHAQLATRLNEAKESGRLNLRCAASRRPPGPQPPPAATPHARDRHHCLVCSSLGAPAQEEGELAALPEGLRHLSLSSNGLAHVPDGIGVTCCRTLTHLDLSNNPLTALPDSLGSCPALTHLDVSSCRLAVLPASLAQCRTLQRFYCQVLWGSVLVPCRAPLVQG